MPEVSLPWQDPISPLDHALVDDSDIAALKEKILGTDASVADLVSAAWASASTYRDSDKRGGANGARVRLAPQKDWTVNDPARLAKTLGALEQVKSDFDAAQGTARKTAQDAAGKGGKTISMADLIVLGGVAAVEKAAADAGVEVTVPFVPGRMDTTEELTDAESFEWLKPVTDGFRNYHDEAVRFGVPDEHLFLDRAALLTLTAPEWTALSGGLKVIGINHDGSAHGLFTDRPGTLSNDFFRVLTSMDYAWKPRDATETTFELTDRDTGETRYTATRCDLVFGANAQLRNVAEVYAADDGHERLVRDFVAAWHKVMMLDRYDVPAARAAVMSIC